MAQSFAIIPVPVRKRLPFAAEKEEKGLHNAIETMRSRIAKILGTNHASLYLYGSVTMDDFRLEWSDSSLLCLTDKPVTSQQGRSWWDSGKAFQLKNRSALMIAALREEPCRKRPSVSSA